MNITTYHILATIYWTQIHTWLWFWMSLTYLQLFKIYIYSLNIQIVFKYTWFLCVQMYT